MRYPALVVNSEKLKENVLNMRRLLDGAGISLVAVTKCFCAIPEIVDIYVQAGVKQFGDSRLANLKKMPFGNGFKRWLLRIPMLSEAAEVVRYADISLNSELATLRRLSEEAQRIGVRHGVVLMVDIGDLREGVMPADAMATAGEILKLPGVELLGVGTNTNCYGGVIPTVESLSQLVGLAREIEAVYGVKLPIVSGGNSGSVYLAADGKMPAGVNNLRLGESILLGFESSYQRNIAGMNRDAFKLCAQIVELKEKPSLPIGEIGLDAFGEPPVFVDKGMMKRAIVACGRQDVHYEKVSPPDGLEILGGSSDHMILDVTGSDYQVGDVIEFSVTYAAILSLCTSEYVSKVVV